MPPAAFCVGLKPTPMSTGSPAGPAPASSFRRPPSSSCRYQTLTSKPPEKGHLKHDVLPSKGRAPTPTAEPAPPLFSRPRRPAAREGRGGARPADPGPAHGPGEAAPVPDPRLDLGPQPRTRAQTPTQCSSSRTPTHGLGHGPQAPTQILDPRPGPQPPTQNADRGPHYSDGRRGPRTPGPGPGG